jgi:hypothetical protein
MTSPFSLEETLPLPLPYEPEQLPHHTNVERLERRIFEVHAYWRHNATLLTVGFFGFVTLNLALLVGLTLSVKELVVLCALALLLLGLIGLMARTLSAATDGIQRSDRNINALEEEIQKITGSRGYTLNNEVMPLEFYRKSLATMRAVLFAFVPFWLLLPTVALLVPTKATVFQKNQEKPTSVAKPKR